MRTLHSDLTTAQQSASATPYVRVVLTNRAETTVETYATTDATQRIVNIRAAEAFYGGAVSQMQISSGNVVDIAAIVTLNNVDSSFTTKDLRGYKVQIGWGFRVSTTNHYSEGQPFYVVLQKESSTFGRSTVELYCISAFQYLELRKIQFRNITGGPYDSSDLIRLNLMDALTENVTKVFRDDDGSFSSDLSGAANDNSSTLTPFPSAPVATEDHFYIGSSAVFDRVTVEITTALSLGGASLSGLWQYYNGSSWATLAHTAGDNGADSDGTNDLQAAAGVHLLAFDLPTNWASTTINSQNLYWIRNRVTAASGTPSTIPSIRRIGIQRHWGMTVGTSDGIENALSPIYKADVDTSELRVIRDMIDMTHMTLTMTKTGFHLTAYTDAPGSADYTYNLASGHTFFASGREREVVIPNRIVVVSEEPGARNIETATEDNTASQAYLGVIGEVVLQQNATSGTVAARANVLLDRYTQEQFQGIINAPMNCGQEVWDWISVVDGRNSVTYTGRVGNLERVFNPEKGIYRIKLSLGIGSFGIDEDYGTRFFLNPMGGIGSAAPFLTTSLIGADYSDAVTNYVKGIDAKAQQGVSEGFREAFVFPPPPPRILTTGNDRSTRQQLPRISSTAAMSNIVITATDYDTVAWDAGTITLPDNLGESRTIDAGSLDLANDNPYFIYWELGSTALKNSQTYADAMSTHSRTLMATVKRATGTSAATQKATIVPTTGVGTAALMSSQNIGADSITAAAIQADTITTSEINIGSFFRLPPDYKLAAYWAFNEKVAGSTAVDNSINANDGTVSGATIVQGIAGKALDFDGSNDDVTVTDAATIRDIFDSGGAVSFWINTDGVGSSTTDTILNKLRWSISLQEYEKVTFTYDFTTTDGSWTSTSALTADLWFHVAISYNASSASNNPTIYINGVEDTFVEGVSPVGTRVSDSGTNLFIGQTSANGNHFDGTLDEIKLYSTALTQSEIEALALDPNSSITRITGGDITTGTLSAISADLGTITAGTVTSATIRTAASGARIELDDTHLNMITASGAIAANQIKWFDATTERAQLYLDSLNDDLILSTTTSHDINIISDGDIVLYPDGTLDVFANMISDSNITCVALTETSDNRIKTDIATLSNDAALTFINSFTPRTYKRLNAAGETIDEVHYGLIAQEIEDVLTSLSIDKTKFGLIKLPETETKVDYHGNTVVNPRALAYTELIAPLIGSIKALTARIQELEE